MNKTKQIIILIALHFGCICLAQQTPYLPMPKAASMPNYSTQTNSNHINRGISNQSDLFNQITERTQRQNEITIQKANYNIGQSAIQRQAKKEAEADILALRPSINYSLPSWASHTGTEYYFQAFDKLLLSDSLYSLKENTFLIENAFFNNQLDKSAFDQTINNCRTFLISIMKERGYDLNSNTVKNLVLFQFFSETLQLKKSKEKHLPFQYDFDDYMGIKDHSKMFITKLLKTGTGQCHSMPLLYLILANEIGAEAYLSLSPNHSYIRFPDDNGKWYNIELTNGMFSTTSYILQSGYIKSEALQNKIYMQNLSRKELMAQQLVDLAQGYIRKFGYDEFIAEIITKALQLHPNSINANMIKANLDTARFQYVMKQLNINPLDTKQLQQIGYFPKAVELLNMVNEQYNTVDNLGYEPMPAEAYQKWLQAMKNTEQKQENDRIQKMFNGLNAKAKTLHD
ncbi:hypothetical protein E6C50_01090 [Flavobacterium supellecticarium]|uniref:Transglutaminase-like superfamily protein n=1 Tax=Flavobacterium supellecticarium TaxID=2565924 RepID=A0A4V3W8X0_9FLAO|nr:hypothetical protein [Flavobacterium supellecticarium]THF52836.1 hypothetical protein E6C50_01090 [Flavobacterium supellecticarium]